MVSTTAQDANNILEFLAIILLAGVIFSKISKLIKLPDVVLYIIAGIIIGPNLLNLVNIDTYPTGNQLILTFGAAYILYDGGREINLKVLNKVKMSVILLSTFGVLVSMFITAFFAYKILHIEFIYALLLGTVVSSTDPSVLVPLFKNMNINAKLKQTIIAESAFNDAVAAIATFAVLGIITAGEFSLSNSLFELFKSSLGGILVGGILGFLSSKAISETGEKSGIFQEHPSEIALGAVIGAYVISDHFGFSGFIAVFVVGMICGNKKILNMYIPDEYFDTHLRFKEVLTIIMRMLIFILLGTHVDFGILFSNIGGALLVVAALIFVARPISAYLSVILDKKAQWEFKEIVYLMWVRETGVIPAALAGMLVSMNLPNAKIISSVTFATIFITLTFQASTAKLLAQILKLERK
ncbi:cation:proton antiporter [Clostridium grantii]|uniref:Sodium/proton antiporter, CPA1 family n=1 Tax=Clostridium grantii DSM 8605 TaxID=1121316 RepID=A0A1M5VVW3_9CLOT|nr:sodium:proton antiporter [Clostridium grantii]SHH79083.1 sodium/proton antiporter, CPA1 family [Clostridium grantii DSM 8605]